MTEYDFHEDVGAYLLGALSESETLAFEDQLRVDPDLKAEVDHLRVASDALPNSPIQMTPPPELKSRVMAIVNAEAELLHAAGAGADRPAAVKPRRNPLAWFTLRPGLALAATVLVLALGVGALVGSSALDGGDETTTVATLGSAKLIQRDSGHSTLVASKLKSPGPGRVYQVWLQHKGEAPEPTNALFSTNKNGEASVDVPGSLKDVDAVLVTNEPEGGSTAPTTKPVIAANPA